MKRLLCFIVIPICASVVYASSITGGGNINTDQPTTFTKPLAVDTTAQARITMDGVKLSTATLAMVREYDVVDGTDTLRKTMFSNDTGKTFVIDRFDVQITTTSGSAATITVMPKKVASVGTTTNILYNDWSVSGTVKVSTDSFSSSTIAPGESLRIDGVTSTGQSATTNRLKVYLREQ